MNVEAITNAIERYFNGEVEMFDWQLVEDECKHKKKYYFNLVDRLVKNYEQLLADKSSCLDFWVSLRDFLISFKTTLKLPDDVQLGNGYGLQYGVDGKVYAILDVPQYMNTQFVSAAFQLSDTKTKGNDNRYSLKTNHFINDLTGFEFYNSEAQKLCVTGVLRLPDGYSSLVVLPTGGGKSLITQSLAYKDDGLTIVIVPTISLALDQGIAAKESVQRITHAEIFSYSSGSDKGPQIIEAIKERRAKLLFISPEALIKNEEFAKVVSKANDDHYLKNIVIDEAHIVVEWGDLFRTDYQILEPWRKKLLASNPDLKTILLSATVDKNTGILLKKMFSDQKRWVEFRCDSLRKEPRYCVVNCKSFAEKKRRILELVKLMPHPLIIYTMKPERAETIKSWIQEAGYNGVETFTGDTGTAERDSLIRGWKKNEFDIMVATSAFGMGVDKPDVRTVIHEFVPDNPNLFYQELGRGGRDGLPCLSILCIYPDEDVEFFQRNKVLSVDKAIGRWKSMFWSPKSKRIEDYVFIDTKIKPTYNLNYKYDVASGRDVQWNIYLLLLFRRYNLIDILDVEYEKEEERYIFKIRVIDERLSVIDSNTEALLLEVRTSEKKRYAEDFETLQKAIKTTNKTCFSEMFIKTYPLVSEYCAGCASHNKIMYDDDDRFVLNKKIDIAVPNNKDYYKEDAFILSSDIEKYIPILNKNGVNSLITDNDDYLRVQSLNPEILCMNFYEFRRIIGSKNYYYLRGTCCVVYSSEPEKFKKEFSIMQRYKGLGFKVIHIVQQDFEVDTTGKKVSAYIGNNITDSVLEGQHV